MPGHNTRSITKLLICLGRICVDYNDFSSSTTIIISTVLLAAAGWIPRFFRQTRNFFYGTLPVVAYKDVNCPKECPGLCHSSIIHPDDPFFSLCYTLLQCWDQIRKITQNYEGILYSFMSHFKEKFEQVESSKLLDDNHWCKFSISQRDPSFFPTT